MSRKPYIPPTAAKAGALRHGIDPAMESRPVAAAPTGLSDPMICHGCGIDLSEPDAECDASGPCVGVEQPAPEPAATALTLHDLRAANVKRQAEWCPDSTPDLSFRGNELAGEVGEACNVIKKLERERQGWAGSRSTPEALAEELADVVICVDLVAMQLGIDLGVAVRAKFNATSEARGLATRIPEPAAKPTVASPAAPYDRLKFIEDACVDVRCINEPTGGDDYDIGWIVIEHYMAEPQERRVGYGRSPAEAIDNARRAIDHRCIACDQVFREGDEVYDDISGGQIHAACAKPKREDFVDLDTGEPIEDGDPTPEPYIWTWDR